MIENRPRISFTSFRVFLGIISLTLFFLNPVIAQKKVKVTAKGSYEARDLTIPEVKAKAIEDAKKNAMIKAGISENVQVSDFLYTFEDDDQFKDIFQSFVSTETGADIIVEETREIKRDINEFGNILVEVEIDAEIIKHKENSDPGFNFVVEGIREYYYENDPLNFNFLPSREGYLKIFNVSENNALILYPYYDPQYAVLNDDPDKLFTKKKIINFPINEYMDGYYFAMDDESKSKEFNLLIFVYTKENYPFIHDVNVGSIMKWIFEIPLDQRAVQQWGIVLKK